MLTAPSNSALTLNPPFMGVAFITEQLGVGYVPWLQQLQPDTLGKFDLVALFFRRASALLGDHGTIGLIATNTIAQGDTRAAGLQRLVAERLVIYNATRSMMWPGEAAVSVAVVHLGKGLAAAEAMARVLDGIPVDAINSRLRAGAERPDPVVLQANGGLSFVGSYVLGMGFVLTPDEREMLLKKNQRNAERIFPYLGGEEVNTSPTQQFGRYVINFGEMSLDEASAWPDLVARLHLMVRPEREKTRDAREHPWWQFWRQRAELYATIRGHARCLVIARDPKHFCFSFQPTDRVLSDKLYIFPIESHSFFAALSSRVHLLWALFLGRTTGGAGTPSYSTSDCFETFPFPEADPRIVIPALDDVGQRLHETRAAYMVATQQGLTQTYNQLKDPDSHDTEILALRELHIEMDRAVLTAYGWTDLCPLVPPYTTPQTDAEKRAFAVFEDVVIDHLFTLNAERAEQERLAGAIAAQPAKAVRKVARKPAAAPTAQATLPILVPFARALKPKPADKFTRCVPLENLRIAAGAFSEHQEREVVDCEHERAS